MNPAIKAINLIRNEVLKYVSHSLKFVLRCGADLLICLHPKRRNAN
jgi:hypothetical protein